MVNAKKAKAQRKAEPKPTGIVSRLTPGELVYYRRVGTKAEAALGAFNDARAALEQAQVRAQAAAEAFSNARAALGDFAEHVLETRKLDPRQHVIRDDGGITRRPEPAAAPSEDGLPAPGDQIEVPAAETKAA